MSAEVEELERSTTGLADGWRLLRLGDVARLGGGTTPSRNEAGYWDGGVIPWATPSDITSLSPGVSTIGSTESMVSERALAECSLQLNPPGTVLMTSRATIGYAAINTVPMTTNQGFITFDAGRDLEPGFLLHWLTAQRANLVAAAGGSTFKELSRGTAKLLPILLPPLDEQRRIAEVLRSVDDAIAAADAVAATARHLLASLGRELMQSPDEEPRAGSARLRLLDVCRPKQHPIIGKADLTADGYPVYGANGQIGFAQSFTHAEPVIAITCRGATCGTVNWVPAKSYVTGNAMALDHLDRERVHERFLFHYVSVWGVARSISGSAQPQITRQSLSCIDIIAPDLSRQAEVADALDAIEAEAVAAEIALAAVRNLKAALMSDLLSCRVRVPA